MEMQSAFTRAREGERSDVENGNMTEMSGSDGISNTQRNEITTATTFVYTQIISLALSLSVRVCVARAQLINNLQICKFANAIISKWK